MSEQTNLVISAPRPSIFDNLKHHQQDGSQLPIIEADLPPGFTLMFGEQHFETFNAAERNHRS